MSITLLHSSRAGNRDGGKYRQLLTYTAMILTVVIAMASQSVTLVNADPLTLADKFNGISTRVNARLDNLLTKITGNDNRRQTPFDLIAFLVLPLADIFGANAIADGYVSSFNELSASKDTWSSFLQSLFTSTLSTVSLSQSSCSSMFEALSSILTQFTNTSSLILISYTSSLTFFPSLSSSVSNLSSSASAISSSVSNLSSAISVQSSSISVLSSSQSVYWTSSILSACSLVSVISALGTMPSFASAAVASSQDSHFAIISSMAAKLSQISVAAGAYTCG